MAKTKTRATTSTAPPKPTTSRVTRGRVKEEENRRKKLKKTKNYCLDEVWMADEASWFEAQERTDNLLVPPKTSTSVYLDKQNRKKFDDHYIMVRQRPDPIGQYHEKILAAEKKGTCTERFRKYWQEFALDEFIPIAGVSKEPAYPDDIESGIVCLLRKAPTNNHRWTITRCPSGQEPVSH
jgi:hypothetical protein